MVAEIERDGIAENVAMGMEARAKAGKFNGGTPPLGYALENSRLVIIPEEAQIVRKVFDMYNSGSGYKHIAQVLNNGGYRTKQGRLFSVGTIQGIISNETYAGWIIWGKVRNWNEKGERVRIQIRYVQKANMNLLSVRKHLTQQKSQTRKRWYGKEKTQ